MAFLNKYLSIKDVEEIRGLFIKQGYIRDYKKNEFFINQGQRSDCVGFILEGGFRYLRYTSEGKEQTVGYSFANDFVVDYASFQLQQAAVINVQAIKNSKILTLSYGEFNDFFNHPERKNIRVILGETMLEDVYCRLLSLYCDSPKERYIKLIKGYPEILNLISLREIASFIKVTPETLSRIRKELSVISKP